MKSTTKRWAAILAVAAACPGPALAQDVTLALPAISMIFSPAYVAEERGFWKQRGLNVKTILVAGPGATNAVLSGSAEVTSTVAERLAHWQAANVVLDPVMVAKSGDSLLAKSAISAMREALFPQAFLITPNLPEAGVLLEQRAPDTVKEMYRAAERLRELLPLVEDDPALHRGLARMLLSHEQNLDKVNQALGAVH